MKLQFFSPCLAAVAAARSARSLMWEHDINRTPGFSNQSDGTIQELVDDAAAAHPHVPDACNAALAGEPSLSLPEVQLTRWPLNRLKIPRLCEAKDCDELPHVVQYIAPLADFLERLNQGVMDGADMFDKFIPDVCRKAAHAIRWFCPTNKPRVALTLNEFTDSGCGDVNFFYARGSIEGGNMEKPRGGIKEDVKVLLPHVKLHTQGVNYLAKLLHNVIWGGTTHESVMAMADLLYRSLYECPDSKIIVGGYSQGDAVVYSVVRYAGQKLRDRVVGAVTFGDTMHSWHNHEIPNFPKEKTKIFCDRSDWVCLGYLATGEHHSRYGPNVTDAARFLGMKIMGWEREDQMPDWWGRMGEKIPRPMPYERTWDYQLDDQDEEYYEEW